MFPTILAACLPLLNVIVVDASGPPGSITDIQTACNQANERDSILVKSGTYPQFEVVDKWLTVAADVGSTVDIQGAIRIRDVEPSKRVTLIGLNSVGTHAATSADVYGLDLASDQGSIRVTNCTFRGADGILFGDKSGWAGVHITNCPDVELSHCTSTGGTGQCGDAFIGPLPGTGGQGIVVQGSTVTLYDCTLHGGTGSDGIDQTNPDGAIGGTAWQSSTSVVFASRTSFVGGNGGSGIQWCASFTAGGHGGDGLIVSAPGPARLLSTTETGGTGGTSWHLNCFTFGPEPSGSPRVGPAGAFVDLVAVGRSMTIAQDPIREGATQMISLQAQPGDRIALILTSQATSVFDPAWNGQRFFPLSGLGTIWYGVGGASAFSLPIPDLGPGVESKTFLLQPICFGVGGRAVLGTPISMLVLDSAF